MILRNLSEEEFPHDWEDSSKERDSLVPKKPYYVPRDKPNNPPRADEFVIKENERTYK